MTWQYLTVRAGVPNQRSRVHLEGVEYILDLRWSQRESRWYFDLRAANGADLLVGVALSLSEPHLFSARGSIAGLPPGEIVMLDPRQPRAYPGLSELGDVVQLVYVDAKHVSISYGSTVLGATSPTDPVYRWGATA